MEMQIQAASLMHSFLCPSSLLYVDRTSMSSPASEQNLTSALLSDITSDIRLPFDLLVE